MPNPRRKRMKWKISKLKKHPKQDAIFGDLPPEQQQALMEDMERRGQLQPIEILPDGTIIKGHQRYLVALMLGWTEIDVIVRCDLAEQGDDAVEVEFISDNLVRRHLSPLARARCIKRLMEIESGGLDWSDTEKLKSRIAQQLHLSVRSVNRNLLALGAPLVVQQAYDRGEITLIEVGKVALLSRPTGRGDQGKREQREIAKRIAAGESPKEVIAQYVEKPTLRHTKVADAVKDCARKLERCRQDLDGRLDEVRSSHVIPFLKELRQAKALIGSLLDKAAK